MILFLIFLASLTARSIYISSARVEKKAIAKRQAREKEWRSPRVGKSAGSHADLRKQSNAVHTIREHRDKRHRMAFFRIIFANLNHN